MSEKRDRDADLAIVLQELLEERRGSKEVDAAMLALVAKLTSTANEDPAKQWDQQAANFRKRIQERGLHDEEIVEGCVSPETGATFTAVVSKGVIQTFRVYEYPDWASKRQREGGRVPDEMNIIEAQNGMPSTDYKQWRWVETYQKDLRLLIGRPLSPTARPPTQSVAV